MTENDALFILKCFFSIELGNYVFEQIKKSMSNTFNAKIIKIIRKPMKQLILNIFYFMKNWTADFFMNKNIWKLVCITFGWR